MNRPLVAAALASLFISGTALAEPIYRCGNTYTATPCPQGRMVAATDVRSGAQRAEAQRVAADERRLATEMKQDRLADEAAAKAANGRAANLGGVHERQTTTVLTTHVVKKKLGKPRKVKKAKGANE